MILQLAPHEKFAAIALVRAPRANLAAVIDLGGDSCPSLRQRETRDRLSQDVCVVGLVEEVRAKYSESIPSSLHDTLGQRPWR